MKDLRTAADNTTSANADTPLGEAPVPIPPLHVAAVVVEKSDLIKALQIYVPQLTDVTVLDPDRFLLSLAPTEAARGQEDATHG
ncbi:MAG: hypothetical protein HY534_01880 [Chloroflexi bacterium]|nr:hypothetical protein [Betaproteobacteria bacterium]MBI4213033.1 hypothetical protein [Chloroflexota bacterium]